MLGFCWVNSRRSFSMVIYADVTPKFKIAAVKAEIHVSTFVHVISKLPCKISMYQWNSNGYIMFFGYATRRNYWEYRPMPGHVVNQRWRSLIGSRYEITHTLARTHDSNEISTVTPTFSRSSNSVELVTILSDVNWSRKSKMATVKPEVRVSQLVYMIELKLQRRLPCFRGWPTQRR